jgi:hypothetical protein
MSDIAVEVIVVVAVVVFVAVDVTLAVRVKRVVEKPDVGSRVLRIEGNPANDKPRESVSYMTVKGRGYLVRSKWLWS